MDGIIPIVDFGRAVLDPLFGRLFLMKDVEETEVMVDLAGRLLGVDGIDTELGLGFRLEGVDDGSFFLRKVEDIEKTDFC